MQLAHPVVLSGKQLWKRHIKDPSAGSIIVDNKLIIGSTDGRLTAFRFEEGSLIWTFEAEGGLAAPPSFANGRIFQPCDDGTLYVISPIDGSELYRVEVDGPMISAVAVSTMVYATDMFGHVYGIDPEAALEKTNRKFIKRFNYLEKQTIRKGTSLHDMSLDEMNEIWEEAKKED